MTSIYTFVNKLAFFLDRFKRCSIFQQKHTVIEISYELKHLRMCVDFADPSDSKFVSSFESLKWIE